MANPLATKNRIQSTVLANEYLFDYGFCREEITFDNSSDLNVQPGCVLFYDESITTPIWIPLTKAIIEAGTVAATDPIRVSIDAKGAVGALDVDDECPLLTIFQGPCILKENAITYTDADEDAASADNLATVVGYLDRLTLVNVDESQDLMDGFSDNYTADA